MASRQQRRRSTKWPSKGYASGCCAAFERLLCSCSPASGCCVGREPISGLRVTASAFWYAVLSAASPSADARRPLLLGSLLRYAGARWTVPRVAAIGSCIATRCAEKGGRGSWKHRRQLFVFFKDKKCQSLSCVRRMSVPRPLFLGATEPCRDAPNDRLCTRRAPCHPVSSNTPS